MPELKKSISIRFLEETRHDRSEMNPADRPNIDRCGTFKTYPESEKIILPRISSTTCKNLWQSLQDRRSRRKFSDQALARKDLSLLLWAAQGITGQAGKYFFRTAPSGGALYPIETYLAINRVEGIAAGIYHFEPQEFLLEKLTSSPPGPDLAAAALGQNFAATAAVTFIWSAVFRRTMSKYGHRGMRYILLDAGHICQNLLLAAEALELSACPMAAFFDREMNDLLHLDPDEESVIYMAAAGRGAAL
ncbi:MAG: SagB/ThcOx family dehydrogenase [Proteobacteria bacterium]|nr:SagB/ThcOx family dehydrogenase [Pseudomonadota bacterium]MBU1739826.1 SagB/ThcOx family dehydrogenase [Pseudomonadota bacterium]